MTSPSVGSIPTTAVNKIHTNPETLTETSTQRQGPSSASCVTDHEEQHQTHEHTTSASPTATSLPLVTGSEGQYEKGNTPLTLSLPPSIDDRSPSLSKTRKFLVAFGMGLTYFIGTAASSSVTLLIPDIARSLKVSELEAQWVVSAYSLAFGCGLLFAGRFADPYGRKRLYLGGLSAFCLFSILSAIPNNRIAICVLRALCGTGLAVADPAGFGIVAMTFREGPGKTIAFAAFGLGAALGVGAGTMIGGPMAALGSRGWAYLFNLLGGLAVIPIVIGVLVIPKDVRDQRLDKDWRIDWFGGVIVTAALFLFCFSLTDRERDLQGRMVQALPDVPTPLAVSLLLLVGFGLWERHLERNTTLPPIVKLSLFTRHGYRITIIVVSTFFVYMNAYGYMYLATIWFQTFMGMTTSQSGLRMLPCMIVGAAASMSTMWLGTRVREPILIVVGCLLGSIATLLFVVVPTETNYWTYQFISLILVPWGTNFMVCLGNVMVSNLVEQDEQSVGGAIFQTSIQIGASIGTCLVSLVSTTRAEDSGSLVRGLRDAFWMITAFSWLGVMLIIGIGLRRVGLAQDIRAKPVHRLDC